MKVREFEGAIWRQERIRIVIRAGADEEVDGYDYQKAVPDSRTIKLVFDSRKIKRVGSQ